jgi:hypothetical protein
MLGGGEPSKALQRRVDNQQEPRIEPRTSATQRRDSSQAEQLLVEFPVRHYTDELGLTERRDRRAEIHNTDVPQRRSTAIEWPVSGCSQTCQEPGASVVASNSHEVEIHLARPTVRQHLAERLAQRSRRALVGQISVGMLAADAQGGNVARRGKGECRRIDCGYLQGGTALFCKGRDEPGARLSQRDHIHRCGRPTGGDDAACLERGQCTNGIASHQHSHSARLLLSAAAAMVWT